MCHILPSRSIRRLELETLEQRHSCSEDSSVELVLWGSYCAVLRKLEKVSIYSSTMTVGRLTVLVSSTQSMIMSTML